MEFSTESRKESLWRNKRPRNRWLPVLSVPVLWHLPGAHLEITNAVNCCRQTGHCGTSGLDSLLSASLFVCLCPFLSLSLSGFMAFFFPSFVLIFETRVSFCSPDLPSDRCRAPVSASEYWDYRCGLLYLAPAPLSYCVNVSSRLP